MRWGECLCMDMETGEVGEKFKPDFKGSRGSNIATMGHPTIGFTNMNQQPAQHAVTVLTAAKEDRVRYFEDRTKKFIPPAEEGDDNYFEEEAGGKSSGKEPVHARSPSLPTAGPITKVRERTSRSSPMRPSISGGTPDSSVSEGDVGGFRLHDRRKDSAPA